MSVPEEKIVHYSFNPSPFKASKSTGGGAKLFPQTQMNSGKKARARTGDVETRKRLMCLLSKSGK